MDLSHLRYAVEIARTHSISQAAENLYMGQPNLSRAIRDLESELQISSVVTMAVFICILMVYQKRILTF